MDAVLILNPTAGQGEGSPQWQTILDLARERGIPVRQTRAAGDAEQFAEEAVRRRTGTVIAAGGDGTIHEVINGMSADFAASTLAILPLGTANDFATTLGIPAGDVVLAMELLETGHAEPIDLVASNCDARCHYIINASTGGFSEIVHGHLDKEMKARWGNLAYLRAALNAMPDICYHAARITIDEDDLTADTCAVVVANGRSAGGFAVAPDADLEDEKLDILIIRTETFLDELRLASSFLTGTHLESEHITFRQARRVRIVTDPPMRFSSDGEMIGETPIEFRVLPHALRVIQPAAT